MTNFVDKLQSAPSNIILHINPIFELLPIPIWRYDDPFLPFAKSLIPATQDLVAGYMFDFASYLTMAGAGAVALERSIALVPKNRVRILHGPFIGTHYSPMADATAFDLDALTVTSAIDYSHYTQNQPHGALLLSWENSSEISTYDTKAGSIHIAGQTYTLTTNEILYASKNDDWLEKVIEGIQALS
ncbi:MAG: hypothetical protein AAF846_05035 [Chloroflexota bacterium]